MRGEPSDSRRALAGRRRTPVLAAVAALAALAACLPAAAAARPPHHARPCARGCGDAYRAKAHRPGRRRRARAARTRRGANPYPDLRFFSATSFWNAPVGRDAPLDPTSATLVATLAHTVRSEIANGNGPWIDTMDSIPVYTVGRGQPETRVELDPYPYMSDLQRAFASVPLPARAQPGRTTDLPLVVWQPSTDRMWEFWRLQQAIFSPNNNRRATVAPGAGRLPAGTYHYTLTATNDRGEAIPSEHFQRSDLTVTTTAPASTVTLSWSPTAGATGYRVYRGTDLDDMRLIGSVPAPAPSTTAVTFADDGSAAPAPVHPPAQGTATTPGVWHARWGGMMTGVSASPGIYRDVRDASGALVQSHLWGVSASGLPIGAGLITLHDLWQGHIDHALQLELPEARAGVFSWPAQRTDGVLADPASIPEGARFRLDPSLDLAALHLPPMTRMIAEAVQRYGLVVSDRTGHAVGFRAESPLPYIAPGARNPYLRWFADPATGRTVWPNRLLARFPWERLQLLRMSLSPAAGG